MMHMPEFPAVINVSNRFSLYGKYFRHSNCVLTNHTIHTIWLLKTPHFVPKNVYFRIGLTISLFGGYTIVPGFVGV